MEENKFGPLQPINPLSSISANNSLSSAAPLRVENMSNNEYNATVQSFKDQPAVRSTSSTSAIRQPIDFGKDSFVKHTSPYEFYGSISEEVLHRYLDRAMQVNMLSQIWWDESIMPGSEGPQYGPGYDPDSNVAPLFDPNYDHGKMLRMILKTGTKFVFDNMIFYPDDDWDYFNWTLKTLKHDNLFLHAHDPEIIVSASLSEFLPKKD